MIDFINSINDFSLKEWFFNNLKTMAISFIGKSFYICLFVCITSIFLYIIGIKKAAKVATGSVIVYFILEGFKTLL